MKYLFNDGWLFLKTELGTPLNQAYGRRNEFVPVDIPHDWLIYDSDRLYEDGTGWYLRTFTWNKEEGQRVQLVFDGVYMDSAVYLNGDLAGEWKYGYSSFWVDITQKLKEGENTLMVRANFQNPNSRWYSGAGIYRDVWMRVTDARLSIEEHGIYISKKRRGSDFFMGVETELARGMALQEGDFGAADYRLVHRLYEWNRDGSLGREIALEPSGGGEMDNCRGYIVKSPELWDIENPALHVLETTLLYGGCEIQKEYVRFGFRDIQMKPDGGFFLNGRHVRLNGVCEHHDLGALGAAFNRAAMKRKFGILKEMGVNAVRGAHNMMAPGAVELADEMGILLISEAFDMWERSKTAYDYARFFKDWSARDVESWVKRDRNHPSVIMWSIGNEIYDTHADGRGQEVTEYLKGLVEKFDPHHNAYATIGSNYMQWENAQKCADILKIAGYNYSEFCYGEHHAKHPDWVIYGSETSSIVQSRGVYHFPLATPILSDDDRQCSSLGNSPTSWGGKSLEDCVTIDRDTPYSMGQFLWTGFDYIGEPTPYHTKNSYFGQVDTAGFPKDSYYVWQSAWTDYKKKPMVHIFPYWDFNVGQTIDVRVCSNAPDVELFLNGRSLGRQHLTHEPGSGRKILADYQVRYEPGALTAIAYDERGHEIARQERRSFSNSERLVLKADRMEISADGRDMLFVEISTVDKDGNPVENACDRVLVGVTGAGRLVGLDNGDSTDYDSYKGKSRRLFNGRLLAMVQAAEVPGEICISVQANGLPGERLLCRSVDAGKQMEWRPNHLVCRDGEPLGGLTALEENTDRPVRTGHIGEVPVRRISLIREGDGFLTPDAGDDVVEAVVEPPEADDRDVVFRVVNDVGVPSHLAKLTQEGNKAFLHAVGDGNFCLRCCSKSGTDDVRLISQLEFFAEGFGTAYIDPYQFVSGSLYTRARGEVGSGNEKGIATARDAETVFVFDDLDFGETGSDEITVPIFALDGNGYPIEIWEGMPGEDGSVLLADVVYQKPSIWNTYQPDTWKLNKTLKGITSVGFVFKHKVHVKGFIFKKYEKAWMQIPALSADSIYGDSFRRTERGVEQIGNNVSLVFGKMDFGDSGSKELLICGRAPKGSNTVHLLLFDGKNERRQIVEFPKSADWHEVKFPIESVRGECEVTFVFLPGSCFDFAYFRFLES